jgi:hypothetical protein
VEPEVELVQVAEDMVEVELVDSENLMEQPQDLTVCLLMVLVQQHYL